MMAVTSSRMMFLENLTNYNSLEGIVLRVVALVDEDYIHKMQSKVHSDGRVEFVGGMGLQLLEALQYSLRFRYVPVNADNWIGRYPNGSLSGMAAQILNGDADIAISQASMVMLRVPGSYNASKFSGIDFISYLHSTSVTRITAIFRQPDASTAKDIILSTFTLQMWIGWIVVWAVILMSVFFMAFFIKSVLSSSGNEVFQFDTLTAGIDDDKDYGSVSADKLKYVDVILWCFSQISGQGWHEIPREMSIRGVFITSMIFAYVVNIFFSAALTCNLASETIPIKTYKDLVNSKLKLYGDKRLPVVYDIIRESYSYRMKQSYKSNAVKVASNNFIQVANSTNLILREAAGFIAFEDAAKSVFQRQGCSDHYFCSKISALDNVIAGTPQNAMFVRKGSPLREVFNRKILMCIERGFIFRINEQYKMKTIVSCEKISSHYRGGLGILDLFSAVFVISVGVALCCFAFIAEKVVHRTQKPPFEYEF